MLRRAMLLLLLTLGVLSQPALATTYYISPTGNNNNNGLSTGAPWLTFAHAFANMANGGCGHTLNLMNGVYGDGTSTGKISLTSRACTQGNELVIQALNERQARIHDNGTSWPILITGTATAPSAYITLDGLVVNSTNNPNATGTAGMPLYMLFSKNIRVLNMLAYNPNKFLNRALMLVYRSQDVLVEMFEGYDFHRHCVTAFESERVTMRLSYCNNRTGTISGGYNSGNGLGLADAMMAMYPCKDCILESSIGEGSNNGMRLNEMNATFGGGVLMSGSKLLGNVCRNCRYGNAMYLNSRNNPGLNYTPQNITIENNAIVDASPAISAGIRCSDCVRVLINKNTLLNSHTSGFGSDDRPDIGATPDQHNIRFTNNIVKGISGRGFSVSDSPGVWSGSNNFSNGNWTAYSPSLPSNWSTPTASVMTDPGLGTCKVWTPDGSAAKAAGAGANVLYQYFLGVETTTPLWNPQTGEFPHGALVAGVNDVPGQSVFDVHKRLNVNTNGCSFPSNYGNGVSGGAAPVPPVGLRIS